MVKVNMPRGSWEIVLDYLESDDNPVVRALFNDISNQVYSQEY